MLGFKCFNARGVKGKLSSEWKIGYESEKEAEGWELEVLQYSREWRKANRVRRKCCCEEGAEDCQIYKAKKVTFTNFLRKWPSSCTALLILLECYCYHSQENEEAPCDWWLLRPLPFSTKRKKTVWTRLYYSFSASAKLMKIFLKRSYPQMHEENKKSVRHQVLVVVRAFTPQMP